jgi:predicted nucleic acid-binding protein
MKASWLSPTTINEMVIFDSSILVDDLRTGCHSQRIAALDDLVRFSAVVLAELWRGATTPAEQAFLRALERNYPLFTPTEKNWLESGMILAKIQTDRGYEPRKLRDLHFDVLIALTARSCGAKLITSNRGDFELIRKYRDFELEVW